MNKKASSIFLIGILVGAMLCVSLASVNGLSFRANGFAVIDLFNGKLARAIEESYDENIFIKDIGVSLWAAIEYRLFNEGRQGLVIGEDDWLFTAEEFVSLPGSSSFLDENIEFIKRVDALLDEKNIELVVVPVPAKARVYHDKLGNREPDKLHKRVYPEFIGTLDRQGLKVVDTLPGMQLGRNQQKQFMQTDTHWSPHGAARVAALVAEAINQDSPVDGDKVFKREPLPPRQHDGDLLKFLPLEPLFQSMLPVPEEIISYNTYEEESAEFDELFSDSVEIVALVGTSYSADELWDFEGSLKRELETDIVNFAQKAKGPIEPMHQFIRSHLEKMPDLELVIWEIPERYLVVDYQAASRLPAKPGEKKNLLAHNY